MPAVEAMARREATFLTGSYARFDAFFFFTFSRNQMKTALDPNTLWTETKRDKSRRLVGVKRRLETGA